MEGGIRRGSHFLVGGAQFSPSIFSFSEIVRFKVKQFPKRIPPDTAWIERAYSKLHIICNVRRANLIVPNIRAEIFMNVLELPVRSCRNGYNGEIELGSQGKNFGEYGDYYLSITFLLSNFSNFFNF